MPKRLQHHINMHQQYIELISQINERLYQLIHHFNLSDNKNNLRLIGCTKEQACAILSKPWHDWQHDAQRGWPFFQLLFTHRPIMHAIDRPTHLTKECFQLLDRPLANFKAQASIQSLLMSQHHHIQQVNDLILQLIFLIDKNKQANTTVLFGLNNLQLHQIASQHYSLSQILIESIPLFKVNWPIPPYSKKQNDNLILDLYHHATSQWLPHEKPSVHPISSVAPYQKNTFLAYELAKLNTRPKIISQLTHLSVVTTRKIYNETFNNQHGPTGMTPTNFSWFLLRTARRKQCAWLLMQYAQYQHLYAYQESALAVLMSYLDYLRVCDKPVIPISRLALLISGFSRTQSIFQGKSTTHLDENIKLIICHHCRQLFLVESFRTSYVCSSCRTNKK